MSASRGITRADKKRASEQVAPLVRRLRLNAKLSKQQLARRLATTASTITRLETGEYFENNLLALLARVAAAVNKRMIVEFVPLPRRRKSA